MAVEEKGRGSGELYCKDNGYSRAKKYPVLACFSSCLDESRLRLWNSLVIYQSKNVYIRQGM